jgi:hypothetical protein
MRADKGGSDAYLDEWRRVTSAIDSSLPPQELAQQIGQGIEHEVSDETLKALIANKGFEDAQ